MPRVLHATCHLPRVAAACHPRARSPSDYMDISASAEIKLRGSSSLNNNKKSYNIKFTVADGDDKGKKLMVRPRGGGAAARLHTVPVA